MNQRPNILMIVSDQHRYDCVGYSKDYPVKTPNIDKLASEGMWFSNAYTPIPLCCPARQALLNGRRPEAFGALWNYDLALKIYALEPSEYCWTKELKENGYILGYVGKWHVNPDYDPTYYGFNHYISTIDYDKFFKEKYPDISFKNSWFGEENPIPLKDSRTHWFADRAVELIEKYEEQNRPWHIRLDFPEPHLPCRPSKPFSDMYNPNEIPEWRSFKDEFENKPYIQKQQLLNWGIEDYTWKEWAPTVARYYGIISQMDDAVGRVLKALDRLGITEDTLVIYTTDHGDMCGGHRMMDKHYVLYEDIVKVPFILRWPGVIAKGSECKKYVYNFLDIQPTIIDILGLEQKEFFHGRSLLPILQGEKIEDWRQEVVSTYNGQQFGLYTQRMIKNDKWKYIWNTTDVDELYDMENDPDELHNLIHAPENREIVSELRKKLYEILLKEGDGLVRSSWMKYQLLANKKL